MCVSFGFRPRRSQHDAIKANYNILKDDKRPYVVEIDLANFFNTVPHKRLMKLLRLRINDPRLLGLIARFLTGNLLTVSGETKQSEVAKEVQILGLEESMVPPQKMNTEDLEY